MPPLSELQGDFAAAAMNPAAPVPASVTSHTGAPPVKRFNVYRNNIHAGLIAVLEGRFPVVARLVGAEFFAATARVYIELHPPRSPILMEYGATFAAFLEGFEPVADVPYLPDVARIEWAWSAAYYAADAEPLAIEELGKIPPDEAGAMTFVLHPSVSTVRSRYPVVTIWSANCADGEPGPIDAGSGGEDAMILRPEMTVEVRRLPAGGADFIDALAQGRTLGQAAAAASRAAEAFDLQANLAGLFGSGAFCAVRTGDDCLADA